MKRVVKQVTKALGFEIRRYDVRTSEGALIRQLLSYYNIDLVVDVGANAGQYAQFLRDNGYTSKIVSFEPLLSAYAQLKKISSRDPKWLVAPRIALGAEAGEIKLNVASNSQSSSVLPMLDSHLRAAPESAYAATELVPLQRLDYAIQNYISNDVSSIFLKIDVQGFEKQVLEGASKIMPHIKGIQLELSLVSLYEGQPLYEEMIDMLKNWGYDLYAILPAFTDVATARMLQVDGIFIKS
jgi:FkbM family methyltransferase